MNTDEKFEVVRGSGNVYRDFDDPKADVKQFKAILAAKIIRVLNDHQLSTRKAEKLTGVAHSEFVRIRHPDLKRFTIDRLITILNKLDQRVDVSVKIHSLSKLEGMPPKQEKLDF